MTYRSIINKRWRQRHRDQLNAIARAYYKRKREYCLSLIRCYQKKYPWSKRLALIKDRCNNPHNKAYKYYGKRGIKCLLTNSEIKKLWLRDGAWDMKCASIDRIDNDGHYEFYNCRFIEHSENIKRRFNKQPKEKQK